MRIRSIRPEFWASEDVAAMDWHTRLVYIGLWSYVDDNGVGRDLVPLIVADLFPLDVSIPGGLPEASRRVTDALAHLSEHGQITRYRVDGKPYLHIVAWGKHQRIEKRSTGRYPLPTTANAEAPEPLPEPSPTTPGAVREGSPLGEGEKGRRGEGEKAALPRGTRITEDWTPSDALMDWAEKNTPNVDVQVETDNFVDYWLAKTGKDATKLDWGRTWQRWMRTAESRVPAWKREPRRLADDSWDHLKRDPDEDVA